MNRRLTSIVVALLVSGVFTLWFSRRFSKNRPAPPPVKLQYAAAAENMQADQVIRPQDLRLVDWPASMPLTGASTTPAPLVGRIVLYPLAQGQPILDRQLSAPGSGTGITAKIPNGMRAISLRTDDVVGVAGFVLPGTHVDVLVTLHADNTSTPLTFTVLQDAEVLAAGQKTEPDPDGKASNATVVTLLVKPEDAERVTLASNQGTIHFVLRNGVDREQFTGPPVQLSQLSGIAPPAPAIEKVIVKPPELVAAKTYSVETILGSKLRTDEFQ